MANRIAGGAVACAFVEWQRQNRPRCSSAPVPPFASVATSSNTSISRSSFPLLPQYIRPLQCSGLGIQIDRENVIGKNVSPLDSEYDMGKQLGEGGFGTVFLGTHRRTGIKRAIKKIPKGYGDCTFDEEIAPLIALDHPHIVKILEYFDEADAFFVVEECCTGGDLLDLLMDKEDNQVTEVEASIIIRQCLKAVFSCHGNHFIHRDIKLDNFMLEGLEKNVKLIDFGLAAPIKTKKQKGYAGTPGFMAPEMMLKQRYDKAVDVWSLGVMLYIMLSGQRLMPKEDSDAQKLIEKGKQTWQRRVRSSEELKKRELSAPAWDLLERMLEFDAKKRITIFEALQHPFVKSQAGKGLVQSPTPLDVGAELDQFKKRMQSFADAPQLKKVALMVLAHLASSLTSEQLKVLEDANHLFRTINTMALDENKSGKADQDGLSSDISLEMLTRLFIRHNIIMPNNFDAVFDKCDTGGTDGLSYNEFMACAISQSTFDDVLYTEASNVIDRSMNGRVDSEDLILLCRSHEYGKEFCDKIIQEVDPTNKGYLSLEEFHCMMRGHEAAKKRPPNRQFRRWVSTIK